MALPKQQRLESLSEGQFFESQIDGMDWLLFQKIATMDTAAFVCYEIDFFPDKAKVNFSRPVLKYGDEIVFLITPKKQ